jgi:hypothetical protein
MMYVMLDALAEGEDLGVEWSDADDFADRSVVDRPIAQLKRARTGSEDRFENPEAAGKDRHPYDLLEAWELHVFAQSSRPGATIRDHERECSAVVDRIIVRLYDLAREKLVRIIPTTGGFVSAPDASQSQTGAVYVVNLTLRRAVSRKQPEKGRGAPGPISNPTAVIQVQPEE